LRMCAQLEVRLIGKRNKGHIYIGIAELLKIQQACVVNNILSDLQTLLLDIHILCNFAATLYQVLDTEEVAILFFGSVQSR